MNAVPQIPAAVRTIDQLDAWIDREAHRAEGMNGHGAPRIATMTGVSKTHVQRRRRKLITRLKRKGECLPGCDASGRRIAYKDSLANVSDTQKKIVRVELMRGTPVARAAKIAVIGSSFAYKLRDELKDELERAGKALPPIKRLGRVKAEAVDRQLDWLPKGRTNLILYRRFLAEVDGDTALARRRTIAALMPATLPVPRLNRPLTFEEQLARIASGQAKIIDKIPLRRPDYAGTLGGIATAALS